MHPSQTTEKLITMEYLLILSILPTSQENPQGLLASQPCLFEEP